MCSWGEERWVGSWWGDERGWGRIDCTCRKVMWQQRLNPVLPTMKYSAPKHIRNMLHQTVTFSSRRVSGYEKKKCTSAGRLAAPVAEKRLGGLVKSWLGGSGPPMGPMGPSPPAPGRRASRSLRKSNLWGSACINCGKERSQRKSNICFGECVQVFLRPGMYLYFLLMAQDHPRHIYMHSTPLSRFLHSTKNMFALLINQSCLLFDDLRRDFLSDCVPTPGMGKCGCSRATLAF